MHLNENLNDDSNNKENDHDPPNEIRRSQSARKEKYAPLGFISS